MAQSRINQLDLANLLAAKKDTGTADAINSAVHGVSTGLNLAESLQSKRLAQQKAQADISAKAQELVNKAQELSNQKQKTDQNSVVVTPPVQPTATVQGNPVPVASYNPTSDQVTPGFQPADRKVSPEAFNAMNPGAEKGFDRAMAAEVKAGKLTPEEAATKVQQTKVPESYTVIADNPDQSKALVLGSKSSQTREVPVPAGYHTGMELSGARGEAMKQRTLNDMSTKMGKALNPSQWTDPAAKLAAVKVAAAERFEPLLDQMRSQPGGGDRRQLMETARQLDNMLTSSGQSSEAITQAFVPDTLKGKVRNFQELVSNVPTGLDAQDFVERIADTFHREAGVAKNQVRQYQAERIGQFRPLRDMSPDTYNANLMSVGIDPKDVDEKGVYQMPAAPIHNEALDWANAQLKTNPNDPKALAVKAKAEKELANGVQPR